MQVISYKDVRKTYRVGAEEIRAIESVTFGVQEYEFATLVGPSGCGKTTLLRITSGLLPLTGGTVIVQGKEVKGPTLNTGLVFQTPVLLPWRTILDNILLPIEMLGKEKTHYQDTASGLLKIVGLSGFENKYPFQLSMGMQQRVSLARVMMYDPPVLLMDEPFSALDALTRDEMDMWLMEVWQKKKKTVLFVTHSVEESVFLGDFVVVMTPRPARISQIFRIDLPRPRNPEVRESREFSEYVASVRRSLSASKGVEMTS